MREVGQYDAFVREVDVDITHDRVGLTGLTHNRVTFGHRCHARPRDIVLSHARPNESGIVLTNVLVRLASIKRTTATDLRGRASVRACVCACGSAKHAWLVHMMLC